MTERREELQLMATWCGREGRLCFVMRATRGREYLWRLPLSLAITNVFSLAVRQQTGSLLFSIIRSRLTLVSCPEGLSSI